MRDLKADLALCEKATPGPWEWTPDNWNGGFGGIVGKDNAEVLFPDHRNEGDYGDAWFEEYPSEADGKFIVEARVGWPEAIERAIRAEGILRAILELTEQGRAVAFTEDWGGNTLTIHIDDAHSHVGVPDGSFDDLLESLYQLLVKGCGLSFVRFVKEGKP